MSATIISGGQNGFRDPLRGPSAAQVARVHARRRTRPRARNRRQRRALQRRQLGVPPAAALSRAGAAGQVELDERGAAASRASAFRIRASSRCSSGSRCSATSRSRSGNAFTLTGRGDPEQLIGLQASAAMMPALGLRAAARPEFLGERGPPRRRARRADRPRACGSSASTAIRRVLGQALTLDGAPYTIIGVLPEAASAFPLNPFQIWVPRPAEVPFLAPSQLNNGGYFFQAIARLRPGVSLQQAREAMNVIAAGYRQANPANVDAPSQIEVVPLLDDAVGDAAAELSDALRRSRLRAADRVREHRQPAAGAIRRPPQGDRRALRARRRAARDVVRQLVTESMLARRCSAASSACCSRSGRCRRWSRSAPI